MKLVIDHHYSPLLAQHLRERGHDVVTAGEHGWEADDDEPLVDLCATDCRALLTNNVADFAVIARQWQSQGRSHYGLIYTSDQSMPRSRKTIGRYVELLAFLMADNPGDDGFIDRVHWL